MHEALDAPANLDPEKAEIVELRFFVGLLEKHYLREVARSNDLAAWELSPLNPILEAGPGEGVNNSDVDLFEYEGNTYLFYATGDQQTWGTVRMAMFPGTMRQFFTSYLPDGAPTIKLSAR